MDLQAILRFENILTLVALKSFLIAPKSVEDGKIPTKKVKVGVKTSHLAVGEVHFYFFW